MSIIYKRIHKIIIRNKMYLMLLTRETTDVYDLTVVPTYLNIYFNFAVDVDTFLLSV